MFQSYPNYKLYFGGYPSGVYGVLNNNYTPAARQYLHNVSMPLLYNQDIILKLFIDNLTQKVQHYEGLTNDLITTINNLNCSTTKIT